MFYSEFNKYECYRLVEDVLRRIEIRNFLCPVRVLCNPHIEDGIGIVIQFEVKNRDSGEMIWVQQVEILHVIQENIIRDRVLGLLEKFAYHEAREAFLWEGRRIYDPHA